MTNPSKPIREFQGPSGSPHDREYAVSSEMWGLWDISQEPKDNSDIKEDPDKPTEREKKLGSYEGQHGVVICGFEIGRIRKFIAEGIEKEIEDGEGGSRKIKSRYPTSKLIVEPDNWTPRYHDEDGKGRNNTFQSRLIVEHTNKHNERKHRSTMWINQSDSQKWAFGPELFWIKDVNVLIKKDHRELHYGPNGFLEGMCEEVTETESTPSTVVSRSADDPPGFDRPTGAPKGRRRYHLCLNMNVDGGHVTTGDMIGQLFHVFELNRALQTGVNLDAEPLGVLGIRADFNLISNPRDWGPPAFGSTLPGFEGIGVVGSICVPLPVSDGEIRTGRFFWGPDTTQCRDTEAPFLDKSEDGGQIAKKRNKTFRPYIKIPREPTLIDPPTEVPPDFPDIITPLFTPILDAIGPLTTTRWREDKAVGRAGTISIPYDIPVGEGLNIITNLIPPEGDPLDVTRWQTDAVISTTGDVLSALTRALTATLDVPDEAVVNTERFINNFIPYEFLKDKKGGKVHIAQYLRGDLAATTSAGPSHVGGWLAHFGQRISSGEFLLDVEMFTPGF